MGKHKIKLILVFLIILLLWIFFNFRLTDVPPGMNGDEASIGYNAILLSRTLRDENKRLLPTFVLTGQDWKQPVTIYSTAILFKIFGPSYTILRGTSTLFVIISAFLLFLFIKEILNFKIAIFGTITFLLIPAIMIQSHLALENVALLPFVVFWVWMVYKYENAKILRYLFFSGISLGISFYSYNGMRLIMPVLALLTIFYIFYLNKFKLHSSFAPIKFFILGIAPFILILPILMTKYPGAIFANNQTSISTYQDFLMPYIASFDLSFLFITGDTTVYHSTSKHGVYLLATLPLFILGIFAALHKRKPILIFILAAFFLSPFLFGLVGSPIHRGSRLLAMTPLYAIIAVLGFAKIFELKNKHLIRILLASVVLLVTINYADFLRVYWFEYPETVKQQFSPPFHTLFNELKKTSEQKGLKPSIETGIYLEGAYATKFLKEVYFPGGLKFNDLKAEILDDEIVLVRVADANTLAGKGFEILGAGETPFNLVVKRLSN